MNTPILPGVYGEHIGNGGSPLGGLGTQLIAILGRGDKMLPAPVMISAEDIKRTKSSGGYTATATLYYKITAYNAQGETVQSGELSVTVAGTVPDPHSVYLKWNLVRGATGYKIYKSATSGVYGASTLMVNIVGQASAFEDNAVACGTGTPPITGGALLIPYNTPTLYFSMSEVRDNHGASKDLGVCSLIADKLALRRLLVVSVDYTAVDAAGTEEAKVAALEATYTTALAAIDTKYCDIVCALDSHPEIAALVKQHLVNNYAIDPRQWRMGYQASAVNDTIGDGVTENTITGNARGLSQKLLVMCAPNTPYITYYDDDGAVVATELRDGSLNAFMAACLKATIGDDATQITQQTASVFDKYGKDFNNSELEYLLQNGVCPFISDAPGQQRCVKGVTTSLDSVEDSEISITAADLRVGKEMVSTAQEFLGKKITTSMLSACKDKVSLKLQSMLGALITKFTRLEVGQDSVNRTWIIIRFLYTPMYSANVLKFEWQYDLSSGTVLRV